MSNTSSLDSFGFFVLFKLPSLLLSFLVNGLFVSLRSVVGDVEGSDYECEKCDDRESVGEIVPNGLDMGTKVVSSVENGECYECCQSNFKTALHHECHGLPSAIAVLGSPFQSLAFLDVSLAYDPLEQHLNRYPHGIEHDDDEEWANADDEV